jgi:adenosylcobinamide-GDP ribazoletransferase
MNSSSPPPARDRWQRPPGSWIAQLLAAVTFYTRIPLPRQWPTQFQAIARYAPLVGLGIGGLVVAGDALLTWGRIPIATRCGLLVALWVLITGGLHLDGAMDTADGLAVTDPARRLTVMADSRTGAFGVMVAILLLGLKTLALIDLGSLRWFGILAAAGWGRWGQVVAIAAYPYLRPTGKGAFHKAHARPLTDWLLGFLALLIFYSLVIFWQPELWAFALVSTLSGCALALLTGAWLNRQLGGQTGDTYGAIVEWTEALLLCLMTGWQTVFAQLGDGGFHFD